MVVIAASLCPAIARANPLDMVGSLFLLFLRAHLSAHGIPWPFSETHVHANGTVTCVFSPTPAPVIPAQFFWQGENRYSACNLPDFVYHGTDVHNAINIITYGRLKTSSEQHGSPHRPEGIYCYPDQQLSWASCYNQGAQFQLIPSGIPLSLAATRSNMNATVPFPLIMRVARSAATRSGSRGQEWVFHPHSLRFHSVIFGTEQLAEFMSRQEPNVQVIQS